MAGTVGVEFTSEETEDTSDGEASNDRDRDNILLFDEVFRQETARIEELFAARDPAGQSKDSARFSLAFSGGGIRAAAFQAGVLWRLAKEGRLKDVEYLTAVSGGGYIASAFCSQCAAAGTPEDGKVDEWYREVVAKTIARMQTNSGDFVRDCVKEPCFTEDYSAGYLPRILDVLVLLGILGISLAVHPIVFVVCFLAPFTIFIDAYWGAAMRATFCAPPTDDHLAVFSQFSYWDLLVSAFVCSSSLLFLVGVARACVPACKLRRVPGRKRAEATTCYLMGHATYHLLKRLTWGIIILGVFVVGVPLEENFAYTQQDTLRICSRFIHHEVDKPGVRCSDLHKGKPWYMDDIFANYTSHHVGDYHLPSDSVEQRTDRKWYFNTFGMLTFGTGALIVFGICFMPLIGSDLFVAAISVAGPLMLLGFMLTCVQYQVFGPITLNKAGTLGEYNGRMLNWGMDIALTAALLFTPFYEDFRALLHMYYKRCLKQNFFADGEDCYISKLGENPYCPFLILTGTSNDFQPPDDVDKISELSFSPLHFGGEETGYVPMPRYRTLSKCAAISGAGCLDAISLSMSNALALRFWLEVLNLSWGDYMIFHTVRCQNITALAGRWEGLCVRMLHRAPSALAWFVIFWLIRLSWEYATAPGVDCSEARRTLNIATALILTVVGLSFYSFVPLGDMLTMSPLLRQLHQVTKYFYVGDKPPRLLYMTDGGVKDCTSIVQLLWRRRERILLVLAAADANDDLNVLKAALEVAVTLKLANFYDPEDPRRNLTLLFERYKEDKEQRTLRIGISYCWGDDSEKGPAVGHLLVIKNRLPDSLAGPIRPPITEREVMGSSEESDEDVSDHSDWDDAAWGDMRNSDLGPFGCCDCCHTQGLNCGPKFPHGSFTGYLYLSPTWCSSLMRLGFHASREAVQEVTRQGSLAESWEARVN